MHGICACIKVTQSIAQDINTSRFMKKGFFAVFKDQKINSIIECFQPKSVSLLIVLLTISLQLNSQTDSLVYSSSFPLKDGVYLTYEQFRANNPVPRSKIVGAGDTAAIDFIKTQMTSRTLRYRDTGSVIIEINPLRAWGFCENRAVYVSCNNDFSRIMLMGNIAQFTAYVTTYMTTGPAGMGGPAMGTPVQTLQQYFLDTKSGRIYDANVDNVQYLIQGDPVLLAEFNALKKRKRKEMMFYYVRLYNEKHPLKFPGNR